MTVRTDSYLFSKFTIKFPLRFGEAWSDSGSSDYNLSAVEVILTADDKNNSGTFLPACQFKIDKEGQLQIELLRNAWRLGNVRIR